MGFFKDITQTQDSLNGSFPGGMFRAALQPDIEPEERALTLDQPLGIPSPTFEPETAIAASTEVSVVTPETPAAPPFADIRQKAELATSGDPAIVWEQISGANKWLRKHFTGEFIPYEEIKTETGLDMGKVGQNALAMIKRVAPLGIPLTLEIVEALHEDPAGTAKDLILYAPRTLLALNNLTHPLATESQVEAARKHFAEDPLSPLLAAGVIRGGVKAVRRATDIKAPRPIKPPETLQEAISPETRPQAVVAEISPLKEAPKTDIAVKRYNRKLNIGETSPQSKSINTILEETYTKFVNQDFPIEKIGNIAGTKHPTRLVQRYRGIESVAKSPIFWKTTRLVGETLEITGKGLQEILLPTKKHLNDLRALMTAQRELELSRRGTIKGLRPKEAQKTLDSLKEKWGEEFGELGESVQEVRDWSDRAILQPLKDAEIISESAYIAIKEANQFYSPYNRLFDGLEQTGILSPSRGKFQPKGAPIKKIKGSERQIIDPLESFIIKSQEIAAFVERARVAKEVVNLRKVSPELAEIIKPIQQKNVPVANVEGQPIFRPQRIQPPNSIVVFENGKRAYYEVPKDLQKALDGMTSQELATTIKILGAPARLLRAGATLSVEFLARNPFRDQFTAMIYSRYGYIPFVDLGRGIFNMAGKTDLYKQFQASGAAHSMLVSLDRAATQATLADVLKTNKGKKIAQTVINPIKMLRILSETMEKGTRVGAFAKAKKKGATALEAMNEARELTLDFSRVGSEAKAINAVVAFFNANVQGVDKMVRTFRDRPAEATMKAVAGITVPSMILWAINHDEEWYKELPQWQKDLFWLFKIGDQIWRIPKPFELGVIFGSGPERMLDWMADNDTEALLETLKTLTQTIRPSILPTAFAPAIENIANRSFFRERPIVPPFLEETRIPALQTFDFTSSTAEAIGEKLSVSPLKVENIVRGYGAGLGLLALNISDKILESFNLVDKKPEQPPSLANLPLVRGFAVRPPVGTQSKSVDELYRAYKKAKQINGSVNALLKEGKTDKAEKLIQENPEYYLSPGLQSVVRGISELLTTRRLILNSRDISVEDKETQLREIDQTITQIAQEVFGEKL